jgi:Rrf2 family protein
MRVQELATEEGLPPYFLATIMISLRQHGFIRSKIGRGGGYSLARSPQRIGIGELIACLESGMAFDGVRRGRHGSSGAALVLRLEQMLTRQIKSTMKKITLAELIGRVVDPRRESDAPMYHI